MSPCDELVRRRNSQDTAALHARMRAATLAARSVVETPVSSRRVRRRLTAAAPWTLLPSMRSSRSTIDPTLPLEVALQRVFAALLEAAPQVEEQVSVDLVEGPVLVIRSGPWPVLHALLARLAACKLAHPVTVLCHRRDESTLTELSRTLGLELSSLLYPRFEPFRTSTLRSLVGATRWRATFVLDPSRSGRGESLEHIIQAISGRDVCVWNADGLAWRQRSLRERLTREEYGIVRGLLRWSAHKENR